MTPASPRQSATALATAAVAADVATLRQLAQEAQPADVEHLAILAAWAIEVLAGRMGVEVQELLERLGRAATPAPGEACPDAAAPPVGGTGDAAGTYRPCRLEGGR